MEHPEQRAPREVTPPADCAGCTRPVPPTQAPPEEMNDVVAGEQPPSEADEDSWQVVGKRGRAVRSRKNAKNASTAADTGTVLSAPREACTVPASPATAAVEKRVNTTDQQPSEFGQEAPWTIVVGQKKRTATIRG
jgi:uracil-DNA glycosylase